MGGHHTPSNSSPGEVLLWEQQHRPANVSGTKGPRSKGQGGTKELLPLSVLTELQSRSSDHSKDQSNHQAMFRSIIKPMIDAISKVTIKAIIKAIIKAMIYAIIK